jgi:hypothetical protein
MFSNPAGQQLLGDELEITRQRLRIGYNSARESIDKMIANIVRGDVKDVLAEPEPILIRRSAVDRPLVLYVLPINTRMLLAEQFLTNARAIVLVIEFNGGAGDPAIVRDILGVTLGEACDAALVALILGDAASNSGLASIPHGMC